MKYKPPSSIPAYNKFRVRALNVDATKKSYIVIEAPDDIRRFVVGAVSELFEENYWLSADGVTPEDMYRVVNDEVRFLDICDVIAECINTSDEVQKAIQDKAGNGFGPRTVINNTQYSQNVFISGSHGDDNGCGNDAKFGRIKALVSYIDTVMLDFFQTLDAATNIISQADELISAIPVIETLPIDELVGLVGDTGEYWRDSYEASVNTQLLEDIECQLWCAVGSECDVTIADVRALIEERYNLTSTEGQLNVLSGVAVIARIAATISRGGLGTYIGDDFVYLSWLLQIAAVEASGQFFGVKPVDYATASANGSPNSGWSNCAACGWSSVIDFSVSDYASLITPIDANFPPVYDASGGYYEGGRDSGGCRGGLVLSFTPASVTRIQVNYDQNLTDTNTRGIGYILRNGAVDVADDTSDSQAQGKVSVTGNFSVTADRALIPTGSRQGNASYSRVLSITLEGVGAKPPELP